jgi:hypothetical protein
MIRGSPCQHRQLRPRKNVAQHARRPFCLAAIWLFSSLLALALHAQSPGLTATLDRTAISVGETATLSLTFTGAEPSSIPPIDAPAELSIQYFGNERRFTMHNNVHSSQHVLNYRVSARKPGEYVIPSVQVRIGNRTLASQSLTLRVSQQGSEAVAPDGSASLAFLRLIVPKEELYIGEAVAIEIQLYVSSGQDFQMPQIKGDGFLFGQLPQPAQSTTQIGNQAYRVLSFRTSAVPVKTGTLSIGPVQCSFVLHVPLQGRSRGGGFFDDFFSIRPSHQPKPVTLSSDAAQVEVLPLPQENRPADFNGAVGSYSIVSQASPTTLTAGDPITLRVQIAGQGHLDSLPFPGDAEWRDFQLYPPSSQVKAADQIGLAGVKTFERVIIPQNAGVKEVPAISFSFFDPARRAYSTVGTEPIAVTVTPGASSQEPARLAASDQNSDTPPPRDLAHIKPHMGAITSLPIPLARQRWFLLLQAAPFAFCLAALLWRKQRERLDYNPRLRRRLVVKEIVRRGLRHLAELAQENRSEEFFASLFRLMQEQLGERLDLPSSAITEAVVDERLRGRAPELLVLELHELFQICNQARYAPHRSRQELLAIVPKVEDALRGLRELPDQNAK